VEWIRFSGLERAYGARTIFEGISGVLRDGSKVGLVGPNGAGKSSLVRILAGLESPDGGSLARAREGRLGYLSQAVSGEGAATLREILERAFEHMRDQEKLVRDLEIRLSDESNDATTLERLLTEYGEAREAFDRHGGEGLERRMRSMLAAFGFVDGDLDRPASAFSGGQRTRAALARMLLEEPDYLILDEPTNHLDIETVRWLEDFLRDDPRAALVVSHDRYFLDRVANEVWELDGGELSLYPDMPRDRAYSAYVSEKAERRELAEREYGRFKDEEKRRKAVVAELRTHGSHNYSHVRSREKQLAKMDRIEAPKTSQQTISVKLEAARRATNGLALAVRDIAAAYDKTLFEHLSFSVARGERVAVVGPNGAGKSTLLAILADRRSPDHGSVKVSEGVRTAYFSQDSADELPAGASAVDAVLEGSTILPEEGRSLLGRLGLGGDAGDKPVEAFSGGERRRIMLARLMARSADCLFLDEPTNDLDIPSREGLENVLASYGGAMIVVSHDRYLLQRLADKVLWIRGGAATLLDGGYEQFEELQRPGASERGVKPQKTAPKAQPKADPKPQPKPQNRDREAKDLAATEREVARLDAERARLEREFADPAIYGDRDRVATLERELAEVGAKADAAFARWERLSSAVATATS
jgi:ATP-binding cassette subfamily F protein 3